MRIYAISLYAWSVGSLPEGTVTFQDPNGEIKIKLNTEQCLAIFQLCSQEVISQTQKATDCLMAAVKDAQSKNLLAAPIEPAP